MAFKLYNPGGKRDFEYYLMTNNEAVAKGEALVQTNGRLTKCGADETPQFIAQKTQAAEATSVTPVPVIRVTEMQEWETEANATAAVTLIGNAVTLHTDGLVVTATTTNGVFTLTYTDGVTDGGKVRGYFRG